MKKNKIIIFCLTILAIGLFFFTYYSSDDKEKMVGVEEEILSGDITKSGLQNIIENANYTGTDNRGTFFELNAKLAEVFNDKPNLSNMKAVDAIISLRDGRKIYITSDKAIYDRSSNNTNFMGNVVITESSNKITSDNLDLIMNENLIKIFNNVNYNGERGTIASDEVHIDILKNEATLFMNDSKKQVKVKYKN